MQFALRPLGRPIKTDLNGGVNIFNFIANNEIKELRPVCVSQLAAPSGR